MLQSLINRVLRRFVGVVTHVITDAPVVALTFDDGPHPQYTPRLLDILDRHGAKATFFVIGQAAQLQREILARMARTGHAIGNHSWDHPSFPTIRRSARRTQVRRWEKVVTPYGQKLFRPPYGHQTRQSAFDLWVMGYQVVTWNILGRDWRSESAHDLTQRIAPQLRPGSIVLLHDTLHNAEDAHAFDRDHLLQAVENLLDQFNHQFEFVTVPELMRRGRPQRNNWSRPPNHDWLNSLYPQVDHTMSDQSYQPDQSGSPACQILGNEESKQ